MADVVLTRGGKLICVFSECNHHGDRSYTRIVFTESTDRGRTWSPKTVERRNERVPVLELRPNIKLNDDRLVVVCDKIYGKGESGGTNYLWFADAEGENWEGPFETR